MVRMFLLVTIGALKITVLCNHKGKALDIHCDLIIKRNEEKELRNELSAYPGINLVAPGHEIPLPGCGFPWNVRDK